MTDIHARLATEWLRHQHTGCGFCRCGHRPDHGLTPLEAQAKHFADVLSSWRGITITGETTWYITTSPFARGGRVVAGPFPTQSDATEMRAAIERHSGRTTYWIDQRPLVEANASASASANAEG